MWKSWLWCRLRVVVLIACPLMLSACGGGEQPGTSPNVAAPTAPPNSAIATDSAVNNAVAKPKADTKTTPGQATADASPANSDQAADTAARNSSKPTEKLIPAEKPTPKADTTSSPDTKAATTTVTDTVKTKPPTTTVQKAADETPSKANTDDEDDQQRVAVERFLSVLENNPRRGTALDKVYGYHVERGTLDEVIKKYRDRASMESVAEADSGKVWMIVGLLESLRGQDAVAVQALELAEKKLADNPLVSFYLGQALVLVGRPDQAVLAFERAIERKPAQADMLDVFQALGRVHQRAQRNDQAMEVWNRLEQLFPNDARVQEQIATTLLEEGQFTAALPRFEALAKSTKDPYRQALFRMEAAEIRTRLGQSEPAIADFEKLLGQLNPDNWLFREVRRKLEQVFLRTDDQAGLVKYYESWLGRNPEDIDAMARLSRVLAGLGRSAESQQWLERGLKVAPRRKELRLALIDQLLYEKKFSQAAAQYEALDAIEPNNPDVLRDWGRTLLKDTQVPEADRKQAAAKIWKRLTDAKPKDPLIASQIADLFRRAEMTDEALALYQKGVELAPDAAQYREYLGEYFHRLDRREEALATWRQIVAGKNHTAPNLGRLAEVLAGFGYLNEAITTNAEACELDKKDFTLRLKQVDLLHQAERFDAALSELELADKLTANDEEREAVLSREIKSRQANNTLKSRIDSLRAELTQASTAEAQWFRLARYYEADRQFDEAAKAIAKVLELAPNSVPALAAAAKIQEQRDNLQGAIDTNAKLAAVDRRFRTEYLKKIAQLETRLGRRDKALAAGRDVLASAPGNPEAYEFFAQLCFQLGAADEGLETLRRAVRINPSDPRGLTTLANALAEQFRTDEAIELFWRAFEKGEDVDAKLGVVQRLSELYLQTNQFDKLTDRLERLRRESKEPRELTICLAQTYQQAGDDGTARQELEKLLTADTRDTMLLQQLVKLCESSGDIDEALKYQQQLSKVAAGREQELRLAQLLARSGDSEQASAILSRLTSEERDPEQLLKSLETLFNHGKREDVVAITSRLLRDQPKNWELLYREGVALAEDKPDEAAKRFESLLTINLPDDELDAASKARKKREAAGQKPKTDPNNPSSVSAARMAQLPTFILRMQMAYQIQQAVGLQESERYYGQQQQQVWMPTDFGQARMAAEAWRLSLAQKKSTADEYLALRREQWLKKKDDSRAAWDWYYLQTVRQDTAEMYEAVKVLSQSRDANNEAKSVYLQLLAARGQQRGTYVDPDEAAKRELPPLPDDELNHMLACYNATRASSDQGMMYYYGRAALHTVMLELRRAKRDEQAKKLYDDALAQANTPEKAALLFMVALQEQDFDNIKKLITLFYSEEESTSKSRNSANYLSYLQSRDYHAVVLSMLMGVQAKKQELAEQRPLFEEFLKRTIRTNAKADAAGKKRSLSQSIYGNQSYYQIYNGESINRARGEQVEFPPANEYFDHALLQLLRQTFASHKEADKLADLRAWFDERIQATNAANEAVYWHLGLAYLEWWSDHKDEALASLEKAAQLLPNNVEMRLQLAALLERDGNAAGAFEIVNELTPLDHQSLQAVEVMALRLSVNTGNLDRARQAAERLFGLRLDANLQVQLAQQMFQLGMNELAEAVMSRASRQAGNKTQVLVSLMQQYSSQNKADVAAQIAYQLLRRTPKSASSRYYGGRTTEDVAREQALQILARTGRLPEMIAKVEAQLTKAPDSVRLIETLSEYYTAAGQRDKASELVKRLAGKKTNDPLAEFDLAMKLVTTGDAKEAAERLLNVLKKQPQLVGNRWYEVEQAFRQANKTDALVAALEQADLKLFRQNSHQLGNIISNLFNNEKQKDQALRLFKRAWEAMPDQGEQLMSYVAHRQEIWNLPEIFDYIRKPLIPPAGLPLSNPWRGMGNVNSYSGDGRIETLVTRLLAMAKQKNKLHELLPEIDAALEKQPGWHGGRVLKTLVLYKQDKFDVAKAQVTELLDDPKLAIPGNVLWVISQEIGDRKDFRELSIRCLEKACSSSELADNTEFSYGPVKRLCRLWSEAGEKSKARERLLKESHRKSHENYDPQYQAYRQIENMRGVAAELASQGFHVDAIKLYRELAPSNELWQRAQRYNGDYLKQEVQRGLQIALAGLQPESVAELLSASVTSETKKSDTPPEAIPVLDLLLLVEPADLDKARLQSLIVNLIARSRTEKRAVFEQCQKLLAERQRERPDELAVHVLAVLSQMPIVAPAPAANVSRNVRSQPQPIASKLPSEPTKPLEKLSETAVNAINELIARVKALPPLGGDADGVKPVAADLKSHVALWLVARECLSRGKGSPELAQLAGPLAERALAAAKQQPAHEQPEMLAILREWGQLLLDNGDTAGAEQRWTEMLEAVLPKPTAPKANTAATSGTAASEKGEKKSEKKSPNANTSEEPKAAAAKPNAGLGAALKSLAQSTFGLSPSGSRSPAARAVATTPKLNASPIPTPTQFEQLSQIARLAAQNGLTNLALRAIRDSLRHGPPLDRLSAEQFGTQNAFTATAADDSRLQQSALQVETRVSELEQLLRQHGAKDDVLFDALLSVVMPEFRPNELFLYPRPVANSGNGSPRSVGLLLARTAVAAKKGDVLRERLESKLTTPTSEISARVLLAQLAAVEHNSDAVQEQLAKLQELLKKSPLQTAYELTAHAALPATSLAKLPPAVAPLLEGIVSQTLGNARNPNEEPARTLTFQLARFYLQQKQPELAKKKLDDFVAFLGPVYARYSGDYGQYRRREALLQIAGVYAEFGQLGPAFEMLGQYADMPEIRNYGSSNSASIAKLILAPLNNLPAKQRYELLKSWALPLATRQSVRSIGAAVPNSSPQNDPALTPSNVLASSSTTLVEAARAAGKLDELRDLMRPWAEKNVENSQPLWHLIQLARGEGAKWEPELRKFVDARKAAKPSNNSNQQLSADELALARAALADKDLAGIGSDFGQHLLGQVQRVNQQHISVVRRELGEATVRRTAGANVLPGSDPGLQHWVSGAFINNYRFSQPYTTPWWLAHDGFIVHHDGASQDELLFAYPLTGSFEFSCEAFMGTWGEGNVGYGGRIVEALNGGQRPMILPPGEHERISTHDPQDRVFDFNRLRVKVADGQAQYFVNDHLLWTDTDVSPTSPWLSLNAWHSWQTAFRNLRISGEPVIPREVPLSQGDRLEGWISTFYNETQPPRLSVGQRDAYGREIVTVRDPNPEAYDWAGHEGLILGRRVSGLPDGTTTPFSRLYYRRPLRDRETVRYEFFYDEAGGWHVQPTLGRLALLLEPNGVRLWRMGTSTTSSDGIPPIIVEATDSAPATRGGDDSFLVDATAFRRGPKALPLKPGEWNSVELTLTDDVAKLSLNGTLIFERPFALSFDRQFGFFHDKTKTGAKIRNVVLTGDWPTSLAGIANRLDELTPQAAKASVADRQAKGAVIGELFYSKVCLDIVRQAHAMSPAKRYELLARWVLPGDDHVSWRVFGDLTPEREFAAPLLELVAVAKELGKLDDLAARVEAAAKLMLEHRPLTPHDEREISVVQFVIAQARGDEGAANEWWNYIVARWEKAPAGETELQRWPELTAVFAALREPARRDAAESLAANLVTRQITDSAGGAWELRVRHARDVCRTVIADAAVDRTPTSEQTESLKKPPAHENSTTANRPDAGVRTTRESASVAIPQEVWPLKQWLPRNLVTTEDEASGLTARWELVNGDVARRLGGGTGLLMFQSPLRGNFTLEAELATFGWRESEVQFAGVWARPRYDLGVIDVGSTFENRPTNIEPKLAPPGGDWWRLKLVVADNKAAWWYNDRKIHEQTLAEGHDPWLTIHSAYRYATAARNVRITGQPTIPSEVSLTGGDSLTSGGWFDLFYRNIADTLYEPNGNSKTRPYWEKVNDEIRGQRLSDNFTGSISEALLEYVRPMSAGDVIEYEFWYEPNKSLVHPAVGRVALLLQPDGVVEHTLTHGAFERRGLLPDNVTVVKDRRRSPTPLPLKSGEWNRVTLSLKDDVVALTLNNEPIYERPLDAGGLRTLGLFRYAEQTEARVRNAVLRGGWPTSLPNIRQQELAGLAFPNLSDEHLPYMMTWNMRGERPREISTSHDFAKFSKFVQSTDTGVKLTLPPGREFPADLIGFTHQMRIGGDFDISARFKIERLDQSTLPENWKSTGIDFGAQFPDGQSRIAIERRFMADKDGGRKIRTIRGWKPPNEEKMRYDIRTAPWTEKSGRLRIIRHGAVAWYLVADGDSDNWQIIDKKVVDRTDVQHVLFFVRNFEPNAHAEVELQEITVRAAKRGQP